MKTEFIKLYADNPDQKKINKVVACLRNGGIVIYPTDTIYGIGCDIFSSKAIDKIKRLKQIKGKANFSFICYDLSHISEYTKSLPTPTFKLMKKALPGPFTFILNANNKVPKLLHASKKTVGIRVPDNNIPRMIVNVLGNPIITTSIHDDDAITEYATDPELILEKYEGQVDIVIDGGYGEITASTVVDCTEATPRIVRKGIADIAQYL